LGILIGAQLTRGAERARRRDELLELLMILLKEAESNLPILRAERYDHVETSGYELFRLRGAYRHVPISLLNALTRHYTKLCQINRGIDFRNMIVHGWASAGCRPANVTFPGEDVDTLKGACVPECEEIIAAIGNILPER